MRRLLALALSLATVSAAGVLGRVAVAEGPPAPTAAERGPSTWPPGVWDRDPGPSRMPAAVDDSVRDELRVGRAWHATRMLRRAGAQDGTPGDILLLATAEAGWKHHAAVVSLLEGRPWLASEAGGQGLVFLARAYEETGRLAEASGAYAAYLVSPAAADDSLAAAAGGRRAAILARTGAFPEALAVLSAMGSGSDVVRSWVAVGVAEDAVASGDTARVSAFLGQVGDDEALRAAWRYRADARLAAGDSAGALTAFRELHAREEGARAALAGVEVGALLLAAGDTVGAVRIMRASLDEAPRAAAGRAAAVVLAHGDPQGAETLALARVLDRAGDGGRALRAFDRAARQAGDATALPEADRLSRARLMATVASRQDDAVEEFRALTDTLTGTTDPDLGARTLEVWAGLRRRQGQSGNVATLRRWLLERYPASAEAAEVLWDRGWAADSRGAADAALDAYDALASSGSPHARAGQARMRAGQIHLGRGAVRDAVRVYEAYLAEFPEGRRWEEAAFWAAHARLTLGDTAAARAHVERLRRDEPFSYYAVVAADLLAEPYRMVPLGEAEPVREPGWLTEGMRRIALLEAAGLTDGADAEERRLVARAQGSAQVTLRLAERLVEAGRTIAGINLGWALRSDGVPWDTRLVRVVYPFPFREMVAREAAEWGIDPIMMAALIRQESAFKEDIVSHAGAMGLMQVMPPTGRELAGRHGPEGFQPEALRTAEVNLHLGSAFFLDMSRRYGDLPLVLSAYNAGPTRASRWRNYPEAGDWLRFTERVPFDETRGYIKNVTRNLGVYRILYGPLS